MVCGVPGALSLIATVELRGTVVVGVKVTVMVQNAPGARLVPQLLFCAKSPALPPKTAIELIAQLAPPTFVMVTD